MPTTLCDNYGDFSAVIQQIAKSSPDNAVFGFRIRDTNGLDKIVINRNVVADPIKQLTKDLHRTTGRLTVEGWLVTVTDDMDDNMLRASFTALGDFDAEPVVRYQPMTLQRQRHVLFSIANIPAFREHIAQEVGVPTDDLVLIVNLIPSGSIGDDTPERNRVWREQEVAAIRRRMIQVAAPSDGSDGSGWLNEVLGTDSEDEWTDSHVIRALVADAAKTTPDVESVSDYAAKRPTHNLNHLWLNSQFGVR